jgi:hypothetical protein
MRLRSARALPLVGAVLIGIAAVPAHADDPCAGFKWDVSKERALFAASAQPQAQPAGKDGTGAPVVVPDRLYVLRLAPQDQVSFSVPPGKGSRGGALFAGVVELKLPAAGTYRIAADLPLWVDVATGGKLVPAKDYQAQHSCDAPRKVVEFELDGRERLLLQFSGADEQTVRVTVTRVLLVG